MSESPEQRIERINPVKILDAVELMIRDVEVTLYKMNQQLDKVRTECIALKDEVNALYNILEKQDKESDGVRKGESA